MSEHGSCHCGQVEFEVKLDDKTHILWSAGSRTLIHGFANKFSHCGACKKLSGATATLNQIVPQVWKIQHVSASCLTHLQDNLKILKGELKTYTYQYVFLNAEFTILISGFSEAKTQASKGNISLRGSQTFLYQALPYYSIHSLLIHWTAVILERLSSATSAPTALHTSITTRKSWETISSSTPFCLITARTGSQLLKFMARTDWDGLERSLTLLRWHLHNRQWERWIWSWYTPISQSPMVSSRYEQNAMAYS